MQVATRVAQPLHARVLYLEDEDDQVVLIATDSEGLLRSAYEAIRAAVSEATGVATSRIVVNSNHSHNAPWFNLDVEALLAPHGLHQVDTDYFRAAVGKIAGAAVRAKSGKRTVTISVGSAKVPELSWNRRVGYVKPEDVDRFNRRRRYPIGVTDPTLGLVRLDDRDAKPVAVLAIYASHYIAAGSGNISSSYPGPAMERIEQELGGECVSLFLQGCAGNINPPQALQGGSADAVERAGRLLAERGLPVLRRGIEPIGDSGFVFRFKKVTLPLEPLGERGARAMAVLMRGFDPLFAKPAVKLLSNDPPLSPASLEHQFAEAIEQYKKHPGGNDAYFHAAKLTALGDRLTLARNLDAWSSYDVQVLRAGQLCLVFLPGETFIEVALEIRDRSPFRYTFVSAYNDVTPCYIPVDTAFDEGGYEVGPWCYSTPETSKVMVTEALGLLKSIK
jgi:hypothetical protein